MGARKEEYERVVPHHSIIHVDDFDTPRDLAEYLHMLDQNDTLYNEYFRCGHYRSSLYKCNLQQYSIPSQVSKICRYFSVPCITPSNEVGCIACKTIASQFGLRCIQIWGIIYLRHVFLHLKYLKPLQLFVYVASQIDLRLYCMQYSPISC